VLFGWHGLTEGFRKTGRRCYGRNWWLAIVAFASCRPKDFCRMVGVMMKLIASISFGFALLHGTPVNASELRGPARFCGYAPVVDLLAGEKATTLPGGIHGGSFLWEGEFGSLEVRGIGWAARPKGRIVKVQTDTRPARFAQRRVEGRYEIAIWNGAHGAAYFISPVPFNTRQLQAIDRVSLFEEGQDPSNCSLRTIFVWE